MMFNFWVNQHLFYALASGDARPLAQALRDDAKHPAERAQWAHFLRNHDELDLGRLTQRAARARLRAVRAGDGGCGSTTAASGAGSRRCSATAAALELAYSLMFSLPGTPVLRYGDEIGMGDNLRLKERAAIRTPMQWSAEPNGGFSTAEHARAAGRRAAASTATRASTSSSSGATRTRCSAGRRG